jgi:flagellar biosynthesis/type III secretory pathway protein FliH
MVAFERETGFPTPRRRPRTGAGRSLADVLTPPVAIEPETPPTPASEPSPSEPAPTPPEPVAAAIAFDEAAVPTMLAAAAARARGDLLQELEGTRAAQLAAATAAIAEAANAMAQARADAARADRDVILALVAAIARHVIPRALAHCPLADLEAALPELLERLQGQANVVVGVHPDLVEPLEAGLGLAGDGDENSPACRVAADPALEPGAAVVRWQDGEARHLPDERIAAALELCAGWLAEHTTTPSTHDDQDPSDDR